MNGISDNKKQPQRGCFRPRS